MTDIRLRFDHDKLGEYPVPRARCIIGRNKDCNIRIPHEKVSTHHAEIFEIKDQYTGFRHGKYEQGAPMRLRGAFIFARVFKAKTNPAGIDYWTEVWMRIARMGAKLIPIWVPTDIGDWKRGDSLDIDGFFFKNYAYRVDGAPDMHTPLFVAGGLKRFKMKSHPMLIWVGLAFAVFAGFVAVLFFNMNRQSRRESEEYKARMIDRRRKRRSHVPGGAGA